MWWIEAPLLRLEVSESVREKLTGCEESSVHNASLQRLAAAESEDGDEAAR